MARIDGIVLLVGTVAHTPVPAHMREPDIVNPE
jgi:hypothetical protein